VLDLIGPSVGALVANYDTALLDSGVTTAVAGN
jgi:NADH-quinone oxidoreductase subunit M